MPTRRQLAERVADLFTAKERRGVLSFFRVMQETTRKTYNPMKITQLATSIKKRDYADVVNARAAVLRELQRKWASGGTHYKGKLTDKMVGQAFDALDKHAFGNTLRPMLLTVVPSLTFRINDSSGAAGYVAFRGGKKPMVLTLSHKVFGAMRKGGVYTDREKACEGNVACLVDTLEHEVIHMIHIAFAAKGQMPGDTHHGAFFKTTFFNVFGRTSGTHSYMNTLPKTNDIMRRLRVGSHIQMRAEATRLKGTWRVLQFMPKGRVKIKLVGGKRVHNVNPFAIGKIVKQ